MDGSIDSNTEHNSENSFFISPEKTDGRALDNKNSKFNIMLTNARSLSPKIESLHTMFEEHCLDVAMITESWLKDGKILDRDIIDLEYGTDLKIIYKNRPKRRASARAVGGGVSIIFDKTKCNLRERKIVGNKFKLVAAVGRIGKVPRQVALFCVYLEPRMKVEDLRELNQLVCHEILQLKSSGDPLIFFGGDLNKKSVGPALVNFPDIVQVNSEPTRGDACLDILFSNSSSISPTVWPPLETREGTKSDHKCVVFQAEEQTVRNFKWVRKTARKQTDKAHRAFANELRGLDWDVLLPRGDHPDSLVEKFENKVAELTDKHFPLVSFRCRDNEPQWITHGIRRIAKQKRRVYRREGKTRLWHTLAARSDDLIEQSKNNFVEKASDMGPKAYYSAVKAVSNNGKKADWCVTDLFPGDSEEQAGDKVARFFTQITNQYPPLLESRTPPAAPRAPLSSSEVAKFLAKAKKPSSQVQGDVIPRAMKKNYLCFVEPAKRIFNSVFATAVWPSRWKTETTVVIPKTPNPETLSECRNISCTPFLSKVLESILLEDLRGELVKDDTQYGGIKQCSVNHLLVDLFEAVLSPLDDGNPAVIMGVDFEKAFNRLDHHVCLAELARLGASTTSLELVKSFLTNRSLRVKINDKLSAFHKLCGGSPQGSILGCLLYCVATQQLGTNLLPDELPRTPPLQPAPEMPGTPPDDIGPPDDDGPVQEPAGFRVAEWMIPTSVSPPTEGQDPTSPRQDMLPLAQEGEPNTRPRIITLKYIDDTTTVETVDKETTVRHIQASGSTELVPAQATSAIFEGISNRAGEIGMIVNGKKTQILCISAPNGYSSYCSFRVGDLTLASQASIKLLGFCLGSAPGVHDQLDFIKNKFRRKFWSLVHMRRAGIKGAKLFKLYAVFVRPVIESNHVIYHSMLGKGQSAEIEDMQKLVVRLCFGPGHSYDDILAGHSIMRLSERREKAVERFVEKALKNPRFASRWFRRRTMIDPEIRNRKPYIERRAKTERYYRSPLLHFQRIANKIETRQNQQ